MSNSDKSGLLRLDEGDDVVESVFDGADLFVILLLSLSMALSSSFETCLLLCLGFRAVFVEQFEELGSSVLVQGVRELSNRRWDLEALVQNDLLALQANIGWPFDEASQVTLGLNILADAKVPWGCLKEWVLGSSCFLGGGKGSRGGLLG